MSSILAATLGNTTAAIAPVTDGIVGDALRVPISRLADLREGFAAGRWDPVEEGIPVIVASVNPPALEAFARLSAEAAGVRPEAAGVDFPIPIETDVSEPEKVGVDRLLAALAAYRQVKGACIVVDAGTAVTIDAVSADGVFQGGAIFPGLDLMARALADGTARLPEVSMPTEAPAVGKNTREAIAAGVLRGAAGAVAALIEGMRKTVGRRAPVLLTGGDAPRLVPYLPSDCRDVVPNLVLEGLVIAYGESRKR